MMDFVIKMAAALIGAFAGCAIAAKLVGLPGERAARRMTKTALDIWSAANSLQELCEEQGEKIDLLEKRVRELELLVAEGEEPGHECDDDCVHAGLECLAPRKGKCTLYRKEQEGQAVMEAVSFAEPAVIIRSDGCEYDYYDDPRD